MESSKPDLDRDSSVASTMLSCGRCLFHNHCLRIRMLSLPCGRDVAACFAGCRGMLTVLQGEIAVESGGRSDTVRVGESWKLPESGSFRLWAEELTDVALFEPLPAS